MRANYIMYLKNNISSPQHFQEVTVQPTTNVYMCTVPASSILPVITQKINYKPVDLVFNKLFFTLIIFLLSYSLIIKSSNKYVNPE